MKSIIYYIIIQVLYYVKVEGKRKITCNSDSNNCIRVESLEKNELTALYFSIVFLLLVIILFVRVLDLLIYTNNIQKSRNRFYRRGFS